ncbi:MAG TPA: aldolase [Alphaproteobacteria bacterium]|nr:aldolase [Alphaproteobacteria bacterium]
MRPKAYFDGRVTREMGEAAAAQSWSLPEKMALACRMLGQEGHESGTAGQITAHSGAPGAYLTLGFGIGFDEARPRDLVTVDDDLRVIEGDGTPNPGARFHLWIYRARPDVRCIIHTHPPHASALSTIGEPLTATHMDAAMFYEDCAYLAEWPGVPIGDQEGRIISEALGEKRSILLAHHGLLTTGATVEQAAYLAIFLERAARMQLLARAAGTMKPIPPELGREAHDFMLKPQIIDANFAYYARRALRADPNFLKD